MAAGYGFVHYPQQPGPDSSAVGSAAGVQALRQRLALKTPGFLPYQGEQPGAGIGSALGGPGTAPDASVSPGAPPEGLPMAPVALGAPRGAPSVGAALMARKARHAGHLASLGMTDQDAQTFTGGGSRGGL